MALLLSGAPGEAVAGEGFVVVKGTEGAAIHVDGNRAGTLPLGEIRLAEGKHTIRATKTGYMSAKSSIHLKSLRGETVVLYLKPKTAAGAATRNLFFPGWGSWYSDRRKETLGYLAVQSALVGYALYENGRFESRRDDYDEALAAYENAVGLEEVLAARATRDDAYDKLSSSEDHRNAAIWAAVIVQVAAAADGYFRFPWEGGGADRIALVPAVSAGVGESSLALLLRF